MFLCVCVCVVFFNTVPNKQKPSHISSSASPIYGARFIGTIVGSEVRTFEQGVLTFEVAALTEILKPFTFTIYIQIYLIINTY